MKKRKRRKEKKVTYYEKYDGKMKYKEKNIKKIIEKMNEFFFSISPYLE